MTVTETIQVRERGVLTLPSGLRKRRGIKAGDTYQVIDFEGILVAAADAQCAYLVTFNTRRFVPGLADVEVMRPGRLVMRMREHLVHLA